MADDRRQPVRHVGDELLVVRARPASARSGRGGEGNRRVVLGHGLALSSESHEPAPQANRPGDNAGDAIDHAAHELNGSRPPDTGYEAVRGGCIDGRGRPRSCAAADWDAAAGCRRTGKRRGRRERPPVRGHPAQPRRRHPSTALGPRPRRHRRRERSADLRRPSLPCNRHPRWGGGCTDRAPKSEWEPTMDPKETS